MLICFSALMITCLFVHLLCWLPTHICYYFDYYNILTCLLALMIIWSYVYLLWWSHAYVLVCLHAYMLGLLDDDQLLCWNPLMIACSHALIFTCLISTHMYTHLDDEMSIGLKAKVIVYLHFRELNCFDDCAWTIGRMKVCVLGCLNTHLLVCSLDHILCR